MSSKTDDRIQSECSKKTKKGVNTRHKTKMASQSLLGNEAVYNKFLGVTDHDFVQLGTLQRVFALETKVPTSSPVKKKLSNTEDGWVL